MAFAVITARRGDVQPEKAAGVKGNSLCKGRFHPRHGSSGALALKVRVGPQGEHAGGACGKVEAFRAVAGGEHVGQTGPAAGVNRDAAVDLRARFLQKLHVGPHAHRHHQRVEGQRPAVGELHPAFAKARSRSAEVEAHAGAFRGLPHQRGAGLVQHAREHPVRKVHHVDGLDSAGERLGALQADEPRAEDEHLAVCGDALLKAQRVVQRHEKVPVFHAVKAFDWRHKGPRTCGVQQFIVLYYRAVLQRNGFLGGVDALRGFSQQGGDAVFFIKTVLPPLDARKVGLSLQQVGNQRPAVHVVRLFGNEDDFALAVVPSKALDAARGRRGIADDDQSHVTAPRRRWRCSGSPPRRRAPRGRFSGKARTFAPRRTRSAQWHRRGRTGCRYSTPRTGTGR